LEVSSYLKILGCYNGCFVVIVAFLYNGPLGLLPVLAPAVDHLGAMSRVDVLDVVGRLVLWVQGNWWWWIIARVSG
jgi:hypothetical protein